MRTVRIYLFLLLVVTTNLSAQSQLEPGEPAPGIHVTDWIANVPVDTTLTGKHIVLEFWATWCAPCIAAVPHLNALQARFDRPDLVFISVTDEPPARVNRLLQRVPFHSVVVSDQLGRTQRNFGNPDSGLEAFPLTVLLQPDRTLAWVGTPSDLTNTVMEEFLTGRLPPVNLIENRADTESAIRSNLPQTDEAFLELYAADPPLDTFIMYPVPAPNTSANWINIGRHAAFYAAATLPDIFQSSLGTTLAPTDALDSTYYYLLYLAPRGIDPPAGELERYVLNATGRRRDTFRRATTVYRTELTDRDRLQPTLSTLSTQSEDQGRYLFTGSTIREMLAALGDHHRVVFEGTQLPGGKYDFVIDVRSLAQTLGSLRRYGFRLTGNQRMVDAVRLLR